MCINAAIKHVVYMLSSTQQAHVFLFIHPALEYSANALAMSDAFGDFDFPSI